MTVLLRSEIAGYPCRRGKVRDVYDLGDRLVIVATDRISAFDLVLPNGIPNKGRILTHLTKFWLNFLQTPNHSISFFVADLPDAFTAQSDQLAGRIMLVHKAFVFPIECVVRGYLAGSAWKEYQATRTVCGLSLPSGMQLAEQLPEPIFTPSTKAETGHDENISFDQMCNIVSEGTAVVLREKSVALYQKAATYAQSRGIIIADTKFEWGRLPDGQIILIDEVLTPDSSRFWPLDTYQVGTSPPSFDKQFVRDWLETYGWDKKSSPPSLPGDVVLRTSQKYREAYTRLAEQ